MTHEEMIQLMKKNKTEMRVWAGWPKEVQKLAVQIGIGYFYQVHYTAGLEPFSMPTAPTKTFNPAKVYHLGEGYQFKPKGLVAEKYDLVEINCSDVSGTTFIYEEEIYEIDRAEYTGAIGRWHQRWPDTIYPIGTVVVNQCGGDIIDCTMNTETVRLTHLVFEGRRK